MDQLLLREIESQLSLDTDLLLRMLGSERTLGTTPGTARDGKVLRGLIDAIVLTPDGDSLRIELQGNLAAMLKAAEAQKTGEPLPAIGNWNETSSLDDDKLVQCPS
jgi:hypothetical protein